MSVDPIFGDSNLLGKDPDPAATEEAGIAIVSFILGIIAGALLF